MTALLESPIDLIHTDIAVDPADFSRTLHPGEIAQRNAEWCNAMGIDLDKPST